MAQKKRKKIKHPYTVNVSMNVTLDIRVIATSEGEARTKAWNKFKRVCPRKYYNLLADRED